MYDLAMILPVKALFFSLQNSAESQMTQLRADVTNGEEMVVSNHDFQTYFIF